MQDIRENMPINKQVNPVAAGVAGVIIGAGVGALTTKVLSDKKTRDKIMHSISDTRDKLSDMIKETGKRVKEGREMAEHRIRLGRRRLKRKGVI